MKKVLFILLLSLNCYSQELLISKVDSFVGVDIYDNYYYLKDGGLFKSNLDIDYKNIEYGNPDIVDISNPLQILLYYRFFNKVVLLDNRLNFISEYSVPIGTELIANAGKDKVWIYNNITTLLSIFNLTTQKTEVKSIPITKEIIHLKGNLNQAQTINNQKELIAYNFVARQVSALSIDSIIPPISLHKSEYIKNNHLFIKDKMTIETPETITCFEVVNNHLYYLKDKNIYLLKIPKN